MSWLKPAGTALSWRWSDPAEVINIWVAPRAWDETLAAATGRDGAHAEFAGRFVAEDPLVHQIAFAFKASADHGGPYGRLLTDGLIAALIGHVAQGQASRGPPADPARGGLAAWRLRRVLEYMHANLAEDLPLADLSKLAGLSPRHFCTAFRHSTGLPPHRYLAERRIERARELLADPSLSMTAVAMAVGFGSSQHFATMFRRNTGATPGGYRTGLGLGGVGAYRPTDGKG